MQNQDRKTRADVALNLLRRAVRDDDQDAGDFLVSIVEREELFRECEDDDGQPIGNMEDFLKSLDAEGLQQESLLGSGITASAGRRRRITPDERYQARLAAMGKA